jgi:hypothetical protein
VSTELVPRDVAVVLEDQASARRAIGRGVILLLLIPIFVILAVALGTMFDSFGPLLVAALYTTVGGAVGVAMLGTGIVRLRIATRELDQIEAERIPRARLL